MHSYTRLLFITALISSAVSAEERLLVTKTLTSNTAQEQNLLDALPSSSVISRWEIEQSPAATVIDLLQSQPGIEIGRNGGPGTVSSIFMRGQASKNVAVLVDGVRLQTDALGSVLYTNIPLEQIDRIEILRGNVSAIYGNYAVGGAILIFTKQPTTKQSASAKLTIGSRDTKSLDLGLSGKSEKFAYSLYLNDFSTENDSAINTTQLTSSDPDKDPFSNSSYRMGLDYAVTPETNVGVQLSKSDGQISYDQSGNASLYQADQVSDDLTAYINLTPSERVRSKVSYTWSRNNYTEFTNSVAGTPKKARKTTLLLNNSLRLESSNLSFGLEHANADYTDQYNKVDNLTQSAFLALSGELGDRVDYQLNARHDRTESVYLDWSNTQHDRTDNANTYLASAAYQLTTSTRATALYSTAFAAPTPSEFSGNPSLEPEVHKGYELSLDHNGGSWVTELTYFSNKSEHAIVYNSGYTNNSYVNEGIELQYIQYINDIRLNLSHVLQRPRDEAGARLSRRADNYTTIGLTGMLNTVDWRAELIHSDKRIDRSNSLDAYTVTNLSIGKKLAPSWGLVLKLENVFNAKYQLAYGYDAVPFGAFLSIHYQP